MISGVIIKKIEMFEDERGWLAEVFRKDEIDYDPAMCYVSETKPGVKRGPHEHKRQMDFFVFVGPGKFKVYLWDNRKDSPTYKEKMELEAGEGEKKIIIVPPGVVHGYKCISVIPALCINLPNRLYKGIDKKDEIDEVRWENDPNSPFKI